MKQEISTAKTTQAAVPEIGKKEVTLYYLVIGETENKIVINVGEKTYNKVTELQKGGKNVKQDK